MPARNNLPAQLTPLIGRDRDVAALTRRLADARLLTLTGAGGSGKTRLALAVAEDLARGASPFEGGVWLVELAGLADPDLVPQAIADAVGVRETADRAVVDGLLAGLGPCALLLVLDNCEHVVDGCAAIAASILRACPAVRIMATSQVPLGVPGEASWPVPLLDLPADADAAEPETLVRFGAAQLFAERAHAADPTFRVDAGNARAIAEICRRLDGMPLAIELAAARVRALGVAQIAARLDDAFHLLTRGGRVAAPRHQTLEAAVDWSHALLGDAERAVFRRLAAFAGGFTLAAAEAVVPDAEPGDASCATAIARPAVVDHLGDLVDRSLVVAEPSGSADDGRRYRLLETLRQYASARLAAAGEGPAVQARLVAWCRDLAEAAAPELRGERQGEWLDRLAAEHDNLRQALRCALADPARAADGAALAVALGHFWRTRSHITEGRAWTEAALAAVPAPGAPRADLLHQAGDFALLQADHGRARACYDEGLALRRRLGDTTGTARLLNDLGALASAQADFAAAQALREQSLALLREHGDRWAMADVLNSLGGDSLIQGDHGRARRFFDESLALCRDLGDRQGAARALRNLGLVAMHAGADAEAQACYAESLALSEAIGDRRAAAHCLHTMSNLAINTGDLAAARDHLERSQAIWQAIGDPHNYAYGLQMAASIALLDGAFGVARAAAAESLRLLLGLTDPWGTAMSIGKMADIAVRSGDIPMGLRLFTAAERMLEATGAAMPPAARAGYEAHLAELRARVGAAAYDAAVAAGQALSDDAACTLAMDYGAAPADVSVAVDVPRSDVVTDDVPAIAATTGSETAAVGSPPAIVDPAPANPAPAVALPASALRIEALGPARVARDGTPIGASAWTYAKARELLFFLLEHTDRTREQIGVAFWPDADAGQLRSSLGTVLKHLRRALGDPGWIVFEGDRYRFDRARAYAYDVETFEVHLARAGDAPDAAAAADHLAAALALWRGEYLEDLTVEWAAERRAALERRFLDAATRLGELRLAAGDPQGAGEAFHRALTRDPYLETAHRGIMRALAADGERNRALRHYQTLVDRLGDELAATPDAATAALAERLRTGPG